MPWKEHRIVTLREEFVLRAKARGANKSALCREYGVSRKTGHKRIQRFETGGVEALQDMSRRPHRPVNATDGETVLRIIEARHAHPSFGPKKLRRLLVKTNHRASAGARGGAPGAPATAARRKVGRCSRCTGRQTCKAECVVDGGLQGLVAHARWSSL